MKSFIRVYVKQSKHGLEVLSPVLINPAKVEKILSESGCSGTSFYFNQHSTYAVEEYPKVVKMIEQWEKDNQ